MAISIEAVKRRKLTTEIEEPSRLVTPGDVITSDTDFMRFVDLLNVLKCSETVYK